MRSRLPLLAGFGSKAVVRIGETPTGVCRVCPPCTDEPGPTRRTTKHERPP